MDKEYDYIVVGSGFGGSIASLRLSDTLGSSILTNCETLCAVSRIPEKKEKHKKHLNRKLQTSI